VKSTITSDILNAIATVLNNVQPQKKDEVTSALAQVINESEKMDIEENETPSTCNTVTENQSTD